MPTLYILYSQKYETYYVGSTNNFERRYKEHLDGKSRYTRNLRPLTVVFTQEYLQLAVAHKAEIWVKKAEE